MVQSSSTSSKTHMRAVARRASSAPMFPDYIIRDKLRLPLEISYAVPRQSLSAGPKGDYLRELAATLITRFHHLPFYIEGSGKRKTMDLESLIQVGLRSVGKPGEKWKAVLIGGADQFQRMKTAPNYWVGYADKEIIDQGGDILARTLDDANLVEIGVGDGDKTKYLLKTIAKYGALPDRIILNDIVANEAFKAKRKIKEDFPPERVGVSAGDFFTEAFWAQPMWKELREAKEPTVLLLQGATWNNFSEAKQAWLLDKFNTHLKPGSKVILSIDSTSHKGTLEKGYITADGKEFLVKGVVDSAAKAGIRLDLKTLDCEMSVKNLDIILGPISCAPFKILPCRRFPEGTWYDPAERPIYFEKIRKIPVDDIFDAFHATGMSYEQIRYRPIKTPEPVTKAKGHFDTNQHARDPERPHLKFPHVDQSYWIAETTGPKLA